MKTEYMFTSESVTEGHPDKMCDQISDAIVDRFLSSDPYARVRAECAVSSAIIFIATRFASTTKVDFAHVARKVIKRIGYNQPEFNAKSCSILTSPKALPIEKEWQFNEKELSDKDIDKIVAKNQVTVFGFACNQTPELMPLPIALAHRLAARLARIRRKKVLPYLVPDGKVQVGIVYRRRQPHRIHSVTITANQKTPKKPSLKQLRQDILDTVVKPVFDNEPIRPNSKTLINVNPDGPYQGGPVHHSGLTGRKNAIDTYGEYSRHSGKALSGKDPVRIDRVGAYAARYAAKNIVASGLADECEVMLSYSLGKTLPVSLYVQTFGTGKIPDLEIKDLLIRNFEFRLAGILQRFNLRYLPSEHPEGFYQKLATYGHFGRQDLDLPWEQTDKADFLSSE